jgi:hypothetical protein
LAQIPKLGNRSYEQRELASAALRSFGRQGLPFLRQAEHQESPEIRRRVQLLIKELSAGPTADERRHIRVVELLEGIGTPEAQARIDVWARGAEGAVLTEEARNSMVRQKP